MRTASSLFFLAFLEACGGTTPGPLPSTDAGTLLPPAQSGDAGATGDAGGADAGPSDAGPSDAGGADAGPSLPVFSVERHNAAGSVATLACSGSKGSTTLTCPSGVGDFTAGEGVRVTGGGAAPVVSAIAQAPTIQPSTAAKGAGSHTYCYVVATSDSLRGITAPSQTACVSDEPTLGGGEVWNGFDALPKVTGPAPNVLFYVAVDGGAYTLMGVVGADGGATDFGQRLGDFGGWPQTLPATWSATSPLKNEDLFTSVTKASGTTLTLAAPLLNDVADGSILAHDDTDAVQATISDAEAAGGGVVQLGAHEYNIQRPMYGVWDAPKDTFTTDLTKTPWYSGAGYLYLDHGVAGHIHFAGAGATQTTVHGPPQNAFSTFFVFGSFGDGGRSNPTTYRIQPVDKGVTAVTFVNAADTGNFHPGDDVMLYGQSFGTAAGGTPVKDVKDTEGPNGLDHFHEANTVVSVDGDTITLLYPTSKRFFADANGDDFGIHNVTGSTYHDIAISDLSVSSQNMFFGGAQVYGLVVDSINLQGAASILFGGDGGTPRRHMIIQNSTWTFGNGMNAYKVEDELDQLVDVQFLNNQISGNAAPHTEGPSQGAELYATEGACQFQYIGNDFYNLEITFQDTTDDTITGNRFHNSFLNVGTSYQGGGGQVDHSYLNYASQAWADVENNVFTITSDYTPPWVLAVGHFDSAVVQNNTITYDNPGQHNLLITHGGTVTGNSIAITDAPYSNAILASPDIAPDASAPNFSITDNTIDGGAHVNAVAITDPGASYSGTVCVNANTEMVGGADLTVPASGNVVLKCP